MPKNLSRLLLEKSREILHFVQNDKHWNGAVQNKKGPEVILRPLV